MAISLFETRVMLPMLEQLKPARRFLLDTFFRTIETSNSKNVDIDIMKGKRRLAPFVSPKMEGKVVDRVGFTTRTYTPPYIKPKMVTTAQDFLDRMAGEHVYQSNQNAAQRAASQLVKDLASLEDEINRREEWMAAQLLQDGTVSVVGDGVNDTIDFGMDASHIITLAGGDLWSDQVNATPLDDLRAWRRLISKDSGLTPDVVVMGSDALDAFLNHLQTKTMLDVRRYELGEINPATFPNGAIYYGRIKDVGMDLWVYDEWFYDEGTSQEEPMVPAKKVILGSTMARTARHYGAIQDVEAGLTATVQRFPKSWVEKDPSLRFLMVQSAPLIALHQVDAFVCAQVLA